LGPFHLAAETGAPIVPVLLRGVDRVAPMGSLLIRSGGVRLDYLAPIPTAGWRDDEARERAAEVRAVFRRHLPPAPGSQDFQTAAAAPSPTMRKGVPPGTQA
jgi:1-acyl-sn-glycerol-3-phosphate acyltransferase